MTKQEFAKNIKAKYPQYQNIDDTELTDRILEKYPVYKSQISDTQSKVNVNQPQPEKKGGFLRKVGDFFTSNTQKFGETLGTALSVIDPVTNSLRQGTIDSKQKDADNFLKLAKETSDPVKKKNYLEAAKESANINGYDIFNNPEYQKTAKQIYGEALGTISEGVTLAGLGGLAKAGASNAVSLSQSINNVTKGSKLANATKLVGKAVVETGLPTGVVNASEALQENKTGKEVLSEAGKGVLTGTALGVGTSLLAKGAVSTINKIKDHKLKNAIQSITPDVKDLSKKEKLALVKSGNVSKQGVLSKVKVANTENDLRLAEKFKEILYKGSNQDKVNKLTSFIEEKDYIVGQYLKENNSIFNNAQLKKQILDRINDNVIDPTLTDKVKDQMVDQLLSRIPQNNLEGLWLGRKQFDRFFDKAFTGNPTLKKQLIKETRNAAQDFIESKIVDSKYKLFMKDMSDAFNVLDKVAVKAIKDVGNSKLSKTLKAKPILKTIGKYGAVGALAYLGGEKISNSVKNVSVTGGQ